MDFGVLVSALFCDNDQNQEMERFFVGVFQVVTKIVDHTPAHFISIILHCIGAMHLDKLDGVRPIDNSPSTDYLHHFVKKEKKETERKKNTTDS